MSIPRPILLALALAACTPGAGPSPRNPGDASRTPGLGPAEIVPDLPGPEACADAPLVTLDEIGRGVRAGERVALEVVPRAEVMCTLLYCATPPGMSREDVCCNGCGGGYALRVDTSLLLRFENLGRCSGMDCNLRCEPFGREPTHTYRFVGKNDFKPARENGAIYATSTFTVEKVCRAAEGTGAKSGVLSPTK